MGENGHAREQTVIVLVSAFVANACAQPGVSLIFREASSLVAGLLTGLALAAFALELAWPRVSGKFEKLSLLGAVDFLVRRRFTLAVVCIMIAIIPHFWSRTWLMGGSLPTRLVLIFPKAKTRLEEKASSNVHWSFWFGLEGEEGDNQNNDDDIFVSDARRADVHDVTVLFLRFDDPLDCGRLVLNMADSSRVPESTTFRKDDRTAILVIRGRIKRDVELTIEPAPPAARRI